MFKLLTNYVREQKASLVQVFGLGFVIIIMVSSFLSLNFGTTYVNQQYWENIAQKEFHQEIDFDLDARFKAGSFANSWLDNFNYIDSNNKIDEVKMSRATFQIRKLDQYDEANNLYFYRFYFNNSSDHVFIGEKFAVETKNDYIDFKLSIPFNYPSIEKHNEFLQQAADKINTYVYDPQDSNTSSNQTNFFITNIAALQFYDSKIKANPDYQYAKREYHALDIENQAKLYQYLIMGMLYGDNLSWTRVYNITDLLITGKTFSFIQTTDHDKVNAAILVDGDNSNVSVANLKKDEILIYREFAQENNLKIGQDYIFSGYNFHIVGFATSALAANNATYFNWRSDNKNQTVAFVNQETIEKIASNPYARVYENKFFAFNPELASKNISDKINNQWIYQYFHQKLINDKKIDTSGLYSAITNGIQHRLFLNPLATNSTKRFRVIEGVVWTNINSLKSIFFEIGSTFLALIFIVVSIIVFIVIFKMIDRNKRLIGILKAHGYPNWKLNVSLVVATVSPIILFSFLGSALAVIFSHFIVSTYSTAIILITYGWPFYYQITLIVIFVPFIFLLLFSFILVAFLLRVNALTLINNSWAKVKTFSISAFFSSLVSRMIKNFNFANKLAITTSFRSFGKICFIIIVSIFASTLLLVSFSSAGLIDNLLGLQFASINYKYNTNYNFDSNIMKNFINHDNQLMYKKENISEIRSQPSLYLEINAAIEEMVANPEKSQVIDFRYRYIMGSELHKIRTELIEPNLNRFPPKYQQLWEQNIYFIDYLTNDNGKKDTDLMVSFGFLPYTSKLENPYTNLNFQDAHEFNINTIDTSVYYYDNEQDILLGDWSKFRGDPKTVYGISESADKFLKPGFKNTNFEDFTNLTLEKMNDEQNWLNTNFLNTRNLILDKFKIKNSDTATVKIIPMIGSTISDTTNRGGEGNSIGKTILYRYTGLDKQLKYIIGVVYDGARNLLQNTVLMPELWLNQSIFGSYTNLTSNFANVKFSNFDNSELYQYLPIISNKNDYFIDLRKIFDGSYVKTKGVAPALSMIYDVYSIKYMFKSRQYSLQTLILIFAGFSVFLSFMIIIIISNINIRDNLMLIEILRNLGYSAFEISYIFLIVTLPVLIIFSLFAIFIAPIFTNVVASALSNFLNFSVSVVFQWWYLALTLLFVLLIYFVSYIITWILNVNKKN